MTAPPSSPIRNPKARELQGLRAGIASRVSADAIDWLIVVLIYLGILLGFELIVYFVTGSQFELPKPPVIVSLGIPWVIAVLYLTAGWSGMNRTIGKSVIGLRVITTTGKPLRPRRAFLRALICATFGIIVLSWVIVSRRRAGIHDIAVRTTVIYDWTTHT